MRGGGRRPAAASPFHAGEEEVQARIGVREKVASWAPRAIRPFLPEQHREFYARLPVLVVAARDGAGRPWATIVAGAPGFASSPDPGTLRIDALPRTGDALAEALRPGDDVGILGIELLSRRRSRANGRVVGREAGAFSVSVAQSFGNCPRHITPRGWEKARAGTRPGAARPGTALTASQQRLVEGADTFFVATGYRKAGEEDTGESFGMDASHRGGPPGFVRVEDERHLVFPDYAGNNLFNTLGNLVRDPRVGLLFVDFARGDLLQLTGRARIDWDPPAEARDAGAQRLVRVLLEETIELPGGPH